MGISETSILYFKYQCKLPLFLFSSDINTGAPIIAVRMDSGSSMTLMLLENVSMMIIKLAPRLIPTGTA